MKVLSRVVPAADDGRRLDDALADWLPGALGRPLGRGLMRRLIMAGAIKLDGRPTRRPGMTLEAGQRLTARIDPRRLPPLTTSFVLDDQRILYRDAALLAVDKPPGLPTVPTADAARPSLVAAVIRRLRDETGRDAYLGVHQRLDRDTSGIVIFTLDASANAGLAEQFSAHRVEKTYLALAHRPESGLPASWDASGALVAPGGDSDGPRAFTRFRVVETLTGALLVEARPRTGRKHQIRIQLAGRGAPILGDDRYGRKRPSPGHAVVPRLMLHASRLSLRHPLTRVAIEITCPLPADFVAVLDELRSAHPRPHGKPSSRRR